MINNEYKCNIILDHNSPVYSLLYIKDKNILISSVTKCTYFWKLNDVFDVLMAEINAFCHGKNALKRIDDDRIIVGGRAVIQVLSIKEKKIIKEIENNFLVWTITVIPEKQIFYVEEFLKIFQYLIAIIMKT